MTQQQNLKEYQQNTYLSNDDEQLKNQVVQFSPKQRFQRFNDEIGYSYFKTVYRAYDAETGREVYWHTINGSRISQGGRKRILKDIAILKTFNHINILRCIDSWINQRKREIIFITEMVNGGSLKNLLNKIKRPKLKIIKNWAVQILQGIDYLHSLHPTPFSHKNIKCENLYVNTNTNQIKIGEIGNLSIQTPDSIYSSFINLASSFQQNVEDSQGISIDIYCFGMTLLQIVSGKSPYSQCINQGEIYKKIFNNIKPQALDLITNLQLRNIISLCIGDLKTRPNVKELLEMSFWKTNQQADNQMVQLLQQLIPQTKQNQTQKIFKVNQLVQRRERQNEIIYSFTFDNRKKFDIKITREKRQQFEECINYLNNKLQDKVLQKQDQTTGFSYQQQTKNYLCESRGKQQQLMVFKKDLQSNNNQLSDSVIPFQNKIKDSFTLMYQNYKNSIQNNFNPENQHQYEQQMQQRFLIQKRQLQMFHAQEREKFKIKKKNLNGNIMTYYSPSSYNIIDILELDGEQLHMHNSPDTSEVDKHYTFKNMETKNIDLLDLNFSSILLKNREDHHDYFETNHQIKFQELLSKDLDEKYQELKNIQDQMIIPQLVKIKVQQIYIINQKPEEESPKRDFFKIQKNDHIFEKKIKLDEEQKKETAKS